MRERHPAEMKARELFLAGSPHIETRAHELLSTSRLIGHSYATKDRAGRVRLFQTFGTSKASRSRLIAESPGVAGDIVATIRADAMESAYA